MLNKQKKKYKTREEKYKATFEEIKNTLDLIENEEIVHCLDKESFNGRYYFPKWAVTNMGRVYSLAVRKWCKAYLGDEGHKNNENKYSQATYRVNKTKVHLLVANYFCDKTPIQLYGEKGIEVHHITRYDKNKSCMENNNSNNLVYVRKEDHATILTKIQNGNYEIPDGTDQIVRNAIDSFGMDERNNISLKYDKENNLTMDICIYL